MAEIKTRRRNLMRTESCDAPVVTKPSKPIQIREKKVERHQSQYTSNSNNSQKQQQQQQSSSTSQHQRRNNDYYNYQNNQNSSITDNSDILSLNSATSGLTFVRPVTAISLPAKVQQNEQEVYYSESNNNNNSNNKLITAGARLKNPSCPSIQQNNTLNYSYSIDNNDDDGGDYDNNDNSLTSTGDGYNIDDYGNYYKLSRRPKRSTHPNKQTNYQRKQHQYDYENYSQLNETTRRYLINETNNNNNNTQNLPITITAATETTNSTATINSQNSKIDTLLGLTATLFTTKFECIGQNKTGSDTSIKNIPDSSHISIRSKSVSNLNEKVNNNSILSQTQIKTLISNRYSSNNNSSNSNNNSNSSNIDVNTNTSSTPTTTTAETTQRYRSNDVPRDIKNTSLLSINTITLRNKNNEGAQQQQQQQYTKNNFNSQEDVKRNNSINNYYPNYYSNSNSSNSNGNKSQNFINITENIFIGNLSVIKNERKMCRLNVEYLIDMTNMRPDDLNRQTLGKLPCLCKQQHSRLYLTVELLDTTYKTLFNSFAEVNKFIEKARRANKKVLIFSKEIFQQHLICACAQYLMLDYEMNLENALNTISKRLATSTLYIEKCYLDYLKNFESYLQHLSINLYGTNDNKVRSNIINDDGVAHHPLNHHHQHQHHVNNPLNRNEQHHHASSMNNSAKLSKQNNSRLNNIEQTEKKRYNSNHRRHDDDDDEDDDDDDDDEDDYDEDDDDDDVGRNSNSRRNKKQSQKFTVLPVSVASDIESRRNQNQSNNNLKVAWM